MTIADKLTKLSTDITNAYTAIDNKGGIIPANKNTENLASSISSISGGGSTIVEENDVNFYDYDGTLLYSYSASDFLALTEMPALKPQEGMTAEEWNWPLETAQDYVQTFGELDIGQTCITSDGNTRIYIELPEYGTSPYLGIGVSGTITINWGDNSQEDTMTGVTASTRQMIQHNYSSSGKYVITITPSDENTQIGFSGAGSNVGCFVLSNNMTASSTRNTNTVYKFAIKKIEVGSGLTYLSDNVFYKAEGLETMNFPSYMRRNIGGDNAFCTCSMLKAIILPYGVTYVPAAGFSGTNRLQVLSIPPTLTTLNQSSFSGTAAKRICVPKSINDLTVNSSFGGGRFMNKINLPSTITTFPNYTFSACQSLSYIKIPSGVTSIGQNCFYNCYSVKYYDFREHTSVPTLGTNAFYGISSYNQIVVPDDLYEEWIAATNWSTYASYIVKASDVSI